MEKKPFSVEDFGKSQITTHPPEAYPKPFELGKSYGHAGGSAMKIVGIVESTVYGVCYVGEDSDGNFTPITMSDPTARANWVEIPDVAEWSPLVGEANLQSADAIDPLRKDLKETE